MAGEFFSLKNMNVGSNNSSGVIKATFHSSFSFILTLLYFYLKFIFVNIFLVPMFLIIFKISSSE